MLGLRLPADLARRLDALSRRCRRSRSDLVREAIKRYLDEDGFLAEARRQSLLVAGDEAERQAADFTAAASGLDDA